MQDLNEFNLVRDCVGLSDPDHVGSNWSNHEWQSTEQGNSGSTGETEEAVDLTTHRNAFTD